MVSVLFVLLVGLMAQSGLLSIWTQSEEYGHGLMVVAVLVYLVYRRWGTYLPVSSGSTALTICGGVAGLLFVVLGQASGIYLIGYYGIWLFAVAALYALGGFRLIRQLLVPLLIVLLLFPLPNPFAPMVTAELQLISSKLGVWFIRLMGGSVYLEGNTLDMGGGTKLLVAEACAGLRYLFPLMSLGGILAVILHSPLWIRWTVFLVTIPITIFMNSFRIAVTGILVEAGGASHTEGFLHFFEGWVVFIVAAVLLAAVTAILVRLQPGGGNLLDALSLDAPDSSSGGGSGKLSSSATENGVALPATQFWGVSALALVALVGATLLAERGNSVQDRKSLRTFPAQIGEWSASVGLLPVNIEAVAGASDYFYGDFSAPSGDSVNTYIAYYENQRQGGVPHSPRVCIPGGGWVIESEDMVLLQDGKGLSFEVNRIVTGFGPRKVVSYYWLKQGPRAHSSQMLARLDLIRLSLLENRTDGALVRLFTELRAGERLEEADRRLKRFAVEIVPVIPAYVPD